MGDARRGLLLALLVILGGVAVWLVALELMDGETRSGSLDGPTPVLGRPADGEALLPALSAEPLPMELRFETQGEPDVPAGDAGSTGSVRAVWEASVPGGVVLELRAVAGFEEGLGPTGLDPESEAEQDGGAVVARSEIQLGPYGGARPVAGVGRAADELGDAHALWRSVEPGLYEVGARPSSSALPAATVLVSVRAGVESVVRLDLTPVGVVDVLVVRPDDSPVVDARVRVAGPAWLSDDPERVVAADRHGARATLLRTDARGSAMLKAAPLGTPWTVHVRGPLEGRVDTILLAEPSGSAPVRIELEPAPQVLVRVRDGMTGAAVTAAPVGVVQWFHAAQDGLPRHKLDEALAARGVQETDGAGEARVRAAAGSWVVVVAPGYGLTSLPLGVEARRAGLLDVVLDPSSRPSLQVVDGDARPVVGARVELVLLDAWLQPRAAPLVVESDTDGRVDVAGRAGELGSGDGSLLVTARHPSVGQGSLRIGLDALLSGRDTTSRHVVLQPAGSLVVRVPFDGWPEPRMRLRSSAELDEADLQLDLVLTHLGSLGARNDHVVAHGERRPVDPAPGRGRRLEARWDDVPSGVYSVRVRSRARGLDVDMPPLQVTAGEVTQVTLRPPSPDVAAGTVRVTAGPVPRGDEPPGLAPVAILRNVGPTARAVQELGLARPRRGAVEIQRAPFGFDGVAELTGIPPGRFLVGLIEPDPQAPGEARMRLGEPFDLGPGEQLTITLQP